MPLPSVQTTFSLQFCLPCVDQQILAPRSSQALANVREMVGVSFVKASSKVMSPPLAAICANIVYALGYNACTPLLPSELLNRLCHHLPYHVIYDSTPNLNAVVKAHLSRVGCVAGGGNLRERSAVACLFGPASISVYGVTEVDECLAPSRCHFQVRLRLKLR